MTLTINNIIDAHCHVAATNDTLASFVKENNFRFIGICVSHMEGTAWRDQREHQFQGAQKSPENIAWITTIDVPDYTDDWAERQIAILEEDFARGAIGCKLWKNIGMMLTKPDGSFLHFDDPVFDPVYEYLVQQNKPLMIHAAEPKPVWEEILEGHPMYNFYRVNHTSLYMYDKPEHPHFDTIIAARDNVMEKHPDLTVIGAHYGSQELDIDAMSKTFDRFPNYYIDTSGELRIALIIEQDHDKIRTFFDTYQDRIMFGTDIGDRPAREQDCDQDDLQNCLSSFPEKLQLGLDFYQTDKIVQAKNRQCQGLNLSDKICQKLFIENAINVYPTLNWST
jgi:hypothetical protein